MTNAVTQVPFDLDRVGEDLRGLTQPTEETAQAQLGDLVTQLRARIAAIVADPDSLKLSSTHNPAMLKALTGLISAAGKLITDIRSAESDKLTMLRLIEGWVQTYSVSLMDIITEQLQNVNSEVREIAQTTSDPNARAALQQLSEKMEGPVLSAIIKGFAREAFHVLGLARDRIIGT